MPLLFPSATQTPESVLSAIPSSTSSSSPHYLIFVSSIDPSSGRMWCGDCRDTQQSIEKLVPDTQSQLVFVGERQEWKSPDSPWRKAPFNLSAIPTIIKVEQADSLQSSIESAPRLVEGDLRDESKFKSFVA
ncbi:uncharacterized protein JCM6883_005366 [Sporobolomyces salmoneus]|uniref:uncharacterized protein n=1 Tax=Sporobolomyces salmoneus TaxID=183962 RepID=UPI00316CAC76